MKFFISNLYTNKNVANFATLPDRLRNNDQREGLANAQTRLKQYKRLKRGESFDNLPDIEEKYTPDMKQYLIDNPDEIDIRVNSAKGEINEYVTNAVAHENRNTPVMGNTNEAGYKNPIQDYRGRIPSTGEVEQGFNTAKQGVNNPFIQSETNHPISIDETGIEHQQVRQPSAKDKNPTVDTKVIDPGSGVTTKTDSSLDIEDLKTKTKRNGRLQKRHAAIGATAGGLGLAAGAGLLYNKIRKDNEEFNKQLNNMAYFNNSTRYSRYYTRRLY